MPEAGTWTARELPRPEGSDVRRYDIWSTYEDGGHWLADPGGSSLVQLLTFVTVKDAEAYARVNEGPRSIAAHP